MACEILRSIGFIRFRFWPRLYRLFKSIECFSELFQSHSVFHSQYIYKYCYSKTSCFKTIATESKPKIVNSSRAKQNGMTKKIYLSTVQID